MYMYIDYSVFHCLIENYIPMLNIRPRKIKDEKKKKTLLLRPKTGGVREVQMQRPLLGQLISKASSFSPTLNTTNCGHKIGIS